MSSRQPCKEDASFEMTQTLFWTTECSNKTLQLISNVQGTGNAKIVQYCLNGEWRWLCPSGGVWQVREALVACRQLGYEGMVNYISRAKQFSSIKHQLDTGGTPSHSSTASNDRHFFRLARACTGSESSIENCGGVMEITTCSRYGTLECKPGNDSKCM